MPGLYADLGVPSDASAEEIKRAFRQRAARAHPDKGGSDEEFQKIQRAYAVLRVPERRRAYDERGEEGPPQDEGALILQQVISILASLVEASPAIEHTQLIVQARARILAGRQEIEKQRAALDAKAKKFNAAAERLKRKAGGENRIAMALTAIAVQAEQLRKQGDRMMEQNAAMLVMLEEYEYEVEEQKTLYPTGYQTFSSTSWTTS